MSPQQKERAKQLRIQGWTIKAIAEEVESNVASISVAVRSIQLPKKPRKPKSLRNTIEPVPFQEEDFSAQPDTVLFRHVRVWDFIG